MKTTTDRLAEIEAWGSETGDASSGPPEQFEAAEYIDVLTSALRAVLALHRDVTMLDGTHVCSTCCGVGGGLLIESEPHPCRTVLAITDALSASEAGK